MPDPRAGTRRPTSASTRRWARCSRRWPTAWPGEPGGRAYRRRQVRRRRRTALAHGGPGAARRGPRAPPAPPGCGPLRRAQRRRAGDEVAVAAARARVQLAKTGLGERGPAWWEQDDEARRARWE